MKNMLMVADLVAGFFVGLHAGSLYAIIPLVIVAILFNYFFAKVSRLWDIPTQAAESVRR